MPKNNTDRKENFSRKLYRATKCAFLHREDVVHCYTNFKGQEVIFFECAVGCGFKRKDTYPKGTLNQLLQ